MDSQKQEDLIIEIKEKLASLCMMVESLSNDLKTNYVTKAEFKVAKNDVDDIKNKIIWVERIIIGAVIIGILALIKL